MKEKEAEKTLNYFLNQKSKEAGMEIKERFHKILFSTNPDNGSWQDDRIKMSESCASITKEVAVKFAEWCAMKKYHYSPVNMQWQYFDMETRITTTISSEELFEFFSIAEREGK